MGRATDRQVLWLTGVGHASCHSWELIFPAVALPVSSELGLSLDETLRLAFGLYLLFGLGAPAAGWLSDRVGPTKVLLAGLVFGGLSGAAVCLSEDASSLQLALCALGVAASMYHPAGLSLLSQHFAKVGRAFAVNGMAGNLGMALTPLAAGLIASTLGWRWAYAVLCLPGLVFAFGYLFVARKTERGPARRPSVQQAGARGRAVMPLALMAFAVAAIGLAYRMHTLVTPALLEERVPGLVQLTEGLAVGGFAHTGNLAATAMTSFAYFFGIFGQWLGGRVADRYAADWSYVLFHAASTTLALGLVAATGSSALLLISAYLFFATGMQPIENTLVTELTPVAWRGRAFAGKFVLAFGFGAIGTYVVGWVAPHGGLGASFLTIGVLEFFTVCVAVGLVVLRRRPRRPAAAQ